ncbi:MAG: hypothetical protein Q4G45_09840, partial [Actinomycetia bacterium]|nr:hypothetical protein [Actinomycetes bacterium]
MTELRITEEPTWLSYTCTCQVCGAFLAQGTQAVYDQADQTVRCLACEPAVLTVAAAPARTWEPARRYGQAPAPAQQYGQAHPWEATVPPRDQAQPSAQGAAAPSPAQPLESAPEPAQPPQVKDAAEDP